MTENLDSIFEKLGKYNNSIKLSKGDKKNGTKVYCMEPYAQDLYNLMFGGENTNLEIQSKDLVEGEVYTVVAKTISYDSSEIYTEEVDSKVTIVVPFKEYSKELSDLSKEESRKFLVKVYIAGKTGEYYASEKKAQSVSYTRELFDHYNNGTWFSVKIVKLIRGGYLALYNNQIECFIPGSLAAANVIRDFSSLLNTTINVMVDNYDVANNLFILSYKKYVINSMATRVTDIKFGDEYSGVLTNKPYDFGVFVELDGYFTGLVHKSEFKDYEKACRELKEGDKLTVYVKDVIYKKGQYRIVLTLDPAQINEEKLQWQTLRDKTENQIFSYSINERKNTISIELEGDSLEFSLRRQDLAKNLNRYPLVKVFKVDPINKRLNFEFVESLK